MNARSHFTQTRDERIATLISNPVEFADWWQNRGYSRFTIHDNAIIKAAVAAGLVAQGGQMLWLTSAGRALRKRGKGDTDPGRAPMRRVRPDSPNEGQSG